jgi:hypothetical protein
MYLKFTLHNFHLQTLQLSDSCIFSCILGTYDVILDEKHFRDILMQHVIPPAAKVC